MPTIQIEGDRLLIDWSDGLTTNSRGSFLRFLKLKKEFVCPLSGKVVADRVLLQYHGGRLFCYDCASVKAYVLKKQNEYLKKLYACISETVKEAKVPLSDLELIGFSKGIVGLLQGRKDGVVFHNIGVFDPGNKDICLANIKVKAIFKSSQNGHSIHLLKLVVGYQLLSNDVPQHIAEIQKKIQDLTGDFEASRLRYATGFFRKQGTRNGRNGPVF